MSDGSLFFRMRDGEQPKQGPGQRLRSMMAQRRQQQQRYGGDAASSAAVAPKDVHGSAGGMESGLMASRAVQDEEEVYYVKQNMGYCSMLFSVVQVVVVAAMMFQCGVAPLNINPMVGPYPDALNYWGAKNAVLIVEDGEIWRLLTPILLHAGVIHLVCNVLVQLETGAFFEREWGSGIWLVIYLVSAVGSSVLSVDFMPNSISVGSSGAVMGLFGGKLAEVFCRACESSRTRQARIGHEVRREQMGGVLCSVFLVALFSFIPYVDWAAHLGGLVAGFTVGLICFSCSVESLGFAILWALVGIALTVVYFAWSIAYMYSEDLEAADDLRDVCGYYQQFFNDYECNCMIEDWQDNWGNNDNNNDGGN